MRISVNNTKLFFDVYGSKLKISPSNVAEKPTLIVLHGAHGLLDHTIYVEFWGQFADISQVIFLDQRGCGRSDPSQPSEWNLPQWADDLHEFCLTLGITKPIITGVSMGGHVMCEFVRQYADFPGGLIFCNTEAQFPLDIVCAKLQKLGGNEPAQACREFYTNPTTASLDDYFKLCIPYYGHNAYSKEEIGRCIQHPEVFLHYVRNYMNNFNYLDDMAKIQCPTLLLVGRDSLHVVEAAEAMAEKINPEYLDMKIFEDVGGPVYKDDPEGSYKVVKQFLHKF